MCKASRPSPLLQVLVHLEAVVAGVSHEDLAIGGERHALGTIEGVCQGVDVRQEGPLGVEDLWE